MPDLVEREREVAALVALRAELYATGARPRTAALGGVDALTASERRVAGLRPPGRATATSRRRAILSP